MWKSGKGATTRAPVRANKITKILGGHCKQIATQI